MKKLFALLLTAAMLFALLGCGAKDPVDTPDPGAPDPGTSDPGPTAVSWPNSAVQLVVAYAAGGGTDLTARTLSEALSKSGNFGVVNNTDGGGVIGWEQVRTSDPAICDQLIFALNSMFVTYLSQVSDIDPMSDIQPVFAMDGNIAYFVVVNKDAPYDTLDEMIAYGKEHPGELTLGAGAPGSTMTILTSQFLASTGLDCSLVATSGSDADAVAMVMGGNMSCYLTNQTTTQNYLEAGEVKVLASVLPISDKSVEIIRAIPTLEDLGYENCTMGTTFIVWAPVGADRAVYERMNELFNAALADQAVQDSLAERGCDYVSYGNFDETVARLQSDYASAETAWNAYLASAG